MSTGKRENATAFTLNVINCRSQGRGCVDTRSILGSEYRVLNTNGPLHVGGVSFGPEEFQKMARAQFKVKEKEMPHARGLVGCVKNLTLTEGVGAEAKMFLYDLGNPADGENYSGRVVSTVLNYNKLSFTSLFMKLFY